MLLNYERGYDKERDTTRRNWDLTDRTERSIVTDISESLSYLSIESRANRNRQKLRKELVRAHIENKNQAPSLLQSLVNNLIKSL